MVLEAPGWRSPPLEVAVSFRRRLGGLRRSPAPGLLLWGRSVHGAGLRRPLTVLHLTDDGQLTGVAPLAPGGLVSFRRPGWLVELPTGTRPPPPGARLVVRPILGRCPAG